MFKGYLNRFIKTVHRNIVTCHYFPIHLVNNTKRLFEVAFDGVSENLLHPLDQLPALGFHFAVVVVQSFG